MRLALGHELGLHPVAHALLHLDLQVVLLVDELDVGALVAHLKRFVCLSAKLSTMQGTTQEVLWNLYILDPDPAASKTYRIWTQSWIHSGAVTSTW